MTRLEILSEETGLLIEKVNFYIKEDEFFITGKEALESMKRFGELAFTAGFFYANKEDNIWSTTHHMYDEWLKEQEEEQK